MTDSATPTSPQQTEIPAEPSHPEWPAWDCRLESASEAARPWTVGDKYLLKCEGSAAVEIKEPVSFYFPSESFDYTLHPLGIVNSTSNSVEIMVTGYKPGKHTLPWMEIGNSNSGFKTENLTFEVQSILPPGQPAQPSMNVGALGMAYPLWLWLALALMVLIPSIIVFQKLRRRSQIKKLVESLAMNSSALRPYDQFSKDVRSLVRQYNYHREPQTALEFIEKLNVAFKTYLTRAFKLPALVWGPGELVGELKHRDRSAFKDVAKDLKNGMIELNKAENSRKVSAEDADQLKKHAMVLAERIYKIQEERSRR